MENERIPGCDKIHYLKQYLSGEVLQCIEGHFLFSTVESFCAAKRVLNERYGNPYIVEDAFRSKLAKWPKVPPMNNKAFRQFSDFLRQCLAAVPAIPSLSVFNDVRENQKLQEKLPKWVICRWARIVAQHRASNKGFPSFEKFVNFLVEEVRISCDPAIISLNREKSKDTKPKGQRRTSQALATATANDKSAHQAKSGSSNNTGTTEKKKKSCYLCKGTHTLETCPTFLQKTVEERRGYVRAEKLCYACLGIKHRAKNCKYKKKCSKCKREHPTCLHEEKAVRNTKQHDEHSTQASSEQCPAGSCSSTRAVITDAMSSSDQTHVSFFAGVPEGSNTSFIVPVYLSHVGKPDHKERVYAMLDP